MASRSFRDPIHGFIPVSEAECQLLDSVPFRRLRNIRQLALTNLVYHGAEHTRFGHSLGVMHQATQVFDTVTGKGELAWTRDDYAKRRQLLRLASLCHDLGHPPFSHAGEEARVMPARHEEYSVAIVRATDGTSSQVREVIEANQDAFSGVSADEVADIIEGQAMGVDSFLHEITSGELDADRTDYLRRDSLYCGVHYGRFDNERLVKSLTWVEDSGGNPLLAIEEDGIHAAEGLILARYFMFSQVYFHTGEKAADMSPDFSTTDKARAIAAFFTGLQAAELELLSTADYVRRRMPTGSKTAWLREVRRLKPKVSRDKVSQALAESAAIADELGKL